MSELALPLIGTILGCFSGGVLTYAIGKRMLSDEKILEKLDMIVDEYSQSEESMTKLYKIGAIFGKGLRDGIGIEKMIPKRKGGLEGLIFDVVGNYIGKKWGGREQQQEQEVVPPQNKEIDRVW